VEFTLKTNTGAFDLEANVRRIGPDLLVAIWGGEKPHIGAVAAALPRPSLKDPAVTSATASVICFPSHKEDDLAKRAAEALAAEIEGRTVVTAGIHWDNLHEEGIRQVIQNAAELIKMIKARLIA
jgi:hypothetical protein